MSGQQLHPNLAVIAAEYDEIVRQYQSGQLTPAQASAAVSKLHARDDSGIIWALDANSGVWRRRTINGAWVEDEPPTHGVGTLDGYGLAARPDRFTPAAMIEQEAVSDDVSIGEGVTRREAARRDAQQAAQTPQRLSRRRVRQLLLAAVGAGMLWVVVNGGSAGDPVGDVPGEGTVDAPSHDTPAGN